MRRAGSRANGSDARKSENAFISRMLDAIRSSELQLDPEANYVKVVARAQFRLDCITIARTHTHYLGLTWQGSAQSRQESRRCQPSTDASYP